MDRERWQRIQELFHQAAERPRAEWPAFLKSACDDPSLTAAVLDMLEEDARGASLLDRGVGDVAQGMVEAQAAPVPPAGIGPYRVTGLLGEGGMGVVYRAERTDLGSVVAIKVLRDAWLSPARRDRFVQERRLLAGLNHPSIARLHDAGAMPDGTPWFVMEYVEGLPITEHCRTRKSSIPERLRLFRQVCEAVQHAHRHLVIHRDLKPSNILVTDGGGVKLLDFGISKRLDGPGWRGDDTRTGLRLMTPAYAAPEQFRGGRPAVDTDVYSLGVVLYELLAGRLPFDLASCTPSEAEAILVHQIPERPSLVAARAAPDQRPATGGGRGSTTGRAAWADLDVLALTAMHKDQARRYRTVEALIRDLDHFLAGEPLDARPDEVTYRLAKFVGRNRRWMGAAALVMAAIVSLTVTYTVRVTAARNQALAQAARTQRIQRFMLSLFDGGDKSAGLPDGLRAVTLVDRGLKEARGLAAEPGVQADLYGTLGSIYQKLGNLAQADQLLGSALDQRRAGAHVETGSGSSELAMSLVDLGLLRDEQAKLDEAERLVREGLAEARRRLPPGHVDIARATTALGKVLEDRGAYDKAIPVLEDAVKLLTAAAPDSVDLAAAITELANTHFYAGHYDVCRTLNERVLALDRKLHGPDHPLVSSDIINLGAIQYELGHYAEAEKLYRQGLAITEAWYGPNHQQTAADVTMLGRALSQEGRQDEAVEMLRRALDIRERTFGKSHPSVASTVNELGTIALTRKNYRDAEAAFQRMAAIYREVYGGDNHYLVGIAIANLGSVYLAQDRFTDAEPLFRQAIAIYVKTLSADHLNTGISRIKLGRTLLRERRYGEAVVETRAGYQILRKQMNPTVSWLQKGREDLADELDALHEPAEAAKIRAELASAK